MTSICRDVTVHAATRVSNPSSSSIIYGPTHRHSSLTGAGQYICMYSLDRVLLSVGWKWRYSRPSCFRALTRVIYVYRPSTLLKMGCYITPLEHYTILVIKELQREVLITEIA